MALDYDTIYNSYFTDYEEARKQFVLSALKFREEKLKEKDDIIDNLKYERELIALDIVHVYREDVAISDLNLFKGFATESFWKAWKYFNYKKEIDKKELEEYSNHFGYITRTIADVFADPKFCKLKEVLNYNHEQAYEFVYEYNDGVSTPTQFYVSVPMFGNTTAKNYQDMVFKVSYLVSESCWDLIVADIDYRVVAKALADWLKERKESATTKPSEDYVIYE